MKNTQAIKLAKVLEIGSLSKVSADKAKQLESEIERPLNLPAYIFTPFDKDEHDSLVREGFNPFDLIDLIVCAYSL